MKILVTGGAGYIGSHAARRLLKAGHDVTILDDLSTGRREQAVAASQGLDRSAQLIVASVGDRLTLCKILRERSIEAVLHFAAFSEVGESVLDPGKYYRNNGIGTLGLLDALRDTGVRKLVFSSTSAVYGDPARTPIEETHPLVPINPYGRSKLMMELAIADYAAAHGLNYTILRYFNVAGACPDGALGETHVPESHLIPRVLAALAAQAAGDPSSARVEMFGTDYPTPDGTCIRDFIHVEDVVAAHLLALKNLERLEAGQGATYNLGSERGFSVRQVIDACSKVASQKVVPSLLPRRAGDPAILVASSARIRRELGWKPQYPELETVVAHAWNWLRKSPVSTP